jgi:hypothetical protein
MGFRTAFRALACAGLISTGLSACCALEPPRTAYLGFDRNVYPGDAALPALHKVFAFAGFWLNAPPGSPPGTPSSWLGHRKQLRSAGFGFLVLFNGRLDAAIKSAGIAPRQLALNDAAAAIAAAMAEHFPAGTILFLDQEEGGRMLPEQSAYLLGWTEAIAASIYRPGAYVSGQPVPDGSSTITTAQDIREKVAAVNSHPVALWVAQDACPPAPGCVLRAPDPTGSGTPDALVWQYAQSPRRVKLTEACAQTYAANGSCDAPGSAALNVDLDVASTRDPSRGR